MRILQPLCRLLLILTVCLLLEASCTLLIFEQNPASCGNALVDPGEQCDDGNTVSGDGCSEDCKSTETCGNGVIDSARGEVCDDGNTANGDGCSEGCSSDETCGNLIVDEAAGEECDTGGASLSCDPDCTFARCGDGLTNPAAGEECDSIFDTSICNASLCTLSRCGDGFSNPAAGEQCDTRGSTAVCDADCTISMCGDGFLNLAAGEQCDDGNVINGDGCESNCTPTP